MNKKKKKIIVVGSGVGGLSIAPLLAKKGYEVEIFESNNTVGGRANIIEGEGFKFDTGPSLLNYPWVYEKFFSSLGKNFYDYVKLIKVDPAVKFLWKDHKSLQLSSDLSYLMEEIGKFRKDDKVGLISFINKSQKKYDLAFKKLVTRNSSNVFSWLINSGIHNLFQLGLFNSMYSEINKYFKEKKIVEALSSYSMYLGDSPYKLPGFFSILPFGELQYGLWMPKGGMYGLIQGLIKLNTDFKVKINTLKKVKRIITQNNNAIGIELINGDKFYADIIISNVDSETTFRNLLNEKANKNKSYKMTPSVYTFYWGLNKKIDNLTHHTIFLPNNFKKTFNDLFTKNIIPEDLPFYISIPSQTDINLSPKNKSCVFVLVPCPVISKFKDKYNEENLNKIKNKVFERIAHHKIDFSEKDIIYEKKFSPIDWEKKFGLFDGSAFGPSHNFLQIGPFRNSNKSKKFKNLFFVGASTTPGTGVPMCVLSAQMTSEKIISEQKND